MRRQRSSLQAILRIEFGFFPTHLGRVKTTTAKTARSEAELLDGATNSLLRAVKEKMQKKQGRVDYAKLRKEGYSDRFLTKVEEA